MTKKKQSHDKLINSIMREILARRERCRKWHMSPIESKIIINKNSKDFGLMYDE